MKIPKGLVFYILGTLSICSGLYTTACMIRDFQTDFMMISVLQYFTGVMFFKLGKMTNEGYT